MLRRRRSSRLADAIRGRDILVFNATAADDTLRRNLCAAEIVHTLPSLAMGMDALVQYLASRKWNNLLVFEGPQPADAVMVKAFENSVKKFGARVVARQQFKPGTDPREREKNDPALLSAINRDYDVVFVADQAFDFARQVPYHTVRARPVVGSIDLEPVAWHWTWERHGAPQVNSRFQKLSGGRHMESADWAAWIAVKMVVQATLRTRSAEFAKQRKFILGEGGFDGNKGLALSVRPWDQQLRQAILLAAPYSVVARAPVEGFLHKTNDARYAGRRRAGIAVQVEQVRTVVQPKSDVSDFGHLKRLADLGFTRGRLLKSACRLRPTCDGDPWCSYAGLWTTGSPLTRG